jgi:hypothetical protein
MYRYYQLGEKTEWLPIRDTDTVETTIRKHGGIKMSVLAVSEIIDSADVSDNSHLRYRGPLYFDIDMKEDIPAAAEAALELANRLLRLGIASSDLSIFASGSKGFHLLVPQKCFSNGRAVQGLPKIYKEMALQLYVEGMDLQVYCGGRGNCFRLANVKREGKDFYRVPLHLDELEGMTTERYRELTAAPREWVSDPVYQYAPGLERIFETARRTAKQKLAFHDPVPDAQLQEYAEDWPQCVVRLRDGAVKPDANFNKLGLGLASFIIRAGVSEDRVSALLTKTAESNRSRTYDTPRSRIQQLRGNVHYVAGNPNWQFSCNYMRSLVQGNPCDGCPIGQLRRTVDGTSLDSLIPVVERGHCYYRAGSEDDLISTFVIRALQNYAEVGLIHGQHDVTGLECEIVMKGGRTVRRVIPEVAWTSRSSFLAVLTGVGDIQFFGSDRDVQAIKYRVYNKPEGEDNEADMETIYEVTAAGIHFEDYMGTPTRIYVEPGWAINHCGISGTHQLNVQVQAPPRVAALPDLPNGVSPEELEEIDQVMVDLMSINTPESMAVLLGWFAAAHLKAHIAAGRTKEFPLLNVWGNAGSGKSKTTRLLALLSGVETADAEYAIDLPGTTRFPVFAYVGSTTTVPRILEEFNKSKFVGHAKGHYMALFEIFKAAWDMTPVSRGVVGGNGTSGSRKRVNASIVEITPIAPIIIVSEQAPDEPALQHRTLQVLLTGAGRDRGTPHFQAITHDVTRKEKIRYVARALVSQAMASDVSQVYQWIDSCPIRFPASLENRPRWSYHVVWGGLQFLEATLRRSRLTRSVDRLQELMARMQEKLERDGSYISRRVARSEVDAVVDDMAMAARMAVNDHTKTDLLTSGVHYKVEGNVLYLDWLVGHAIYMRFVRQQGKTVVLDNPSRFLELMEHEEYYMGKTRGALPTNWDVAMLDIAKMREKGIRPELFEGVTT